MKNFTAEQMAAAVSGRLDANPDINIRCVSTDTRKISEGALFVAIVGENFNGHSFCAQAIEKGAVLVMAQEGQSIPEGVPAVWVDDTVLALGRLAAWHRSRFEIPIVAVTGSVGKTTTREMIAAALSMRYNVLKTKGNYNNEIGLPLSVLELDDDHTAAVFELGMRGLGEIGKLSRIVRPSIAVITNVGLSHIERLGSRQNILRAKIEIFEGLDSKGMVVLNGDDELLTGLRGLLPYKTLYYGMDESVDIQGYEAASLGENGVAFKTSIAGMDGSFVVRSPGFHNLSNALAALAVCHVLGLRQSEVEEGLQFYTGEQMRLHILDENGIKIINDSYNAAPASMHAALAVLSELGQGKRTIAVLGDMLELGEWSHDSHLEVGRQVVAKRVDWLIGVGTEAKDYITGARELGMKEERLYCSESAEEAAEMLAALLKPGDVVLFKASRGIHMEKIIEKLFSATVYEPVAEAAAL